jgi:hypothetical protein
VRFKSGDVSETTTSILGIFEVFSQFSFGVVPGDFSIAEERMELA